METFEDGKVLVGLQLPLQVTEFQTFQIIATDIPTLYVSAGSPLQLKCDDALPSGARTECRCAFFEDYIYTRAVAVHDSLRCQFEPVLYGLSDVTCGSCWLSSPRSGAGNISSH